VLHILRVLLQQGLEAGMVAEGMERNSFDPSNKRYAAPSSYEGAGYILGQPLV
jgi:hypothetical protein